MELKDRIKKEEAKLNRLSLLQSKTKLLERRQDTRRKIEFGGLVIKADLAFLPKDILLGALISIKEQLDNEPASELLFQSKGKAAFLISKETK